MERYNRYITKIPTKHTLPGMIKIVEISSRTGGDSESQHVNIEPSTVKVQKKKKSRKPVLVNESSEDEESSTNYKRQRTKSETSFMGLRDIFDE